LKQKSSIKRINYDETVNFWFRKKVKIKSNETNFQFFLSLTLLGEKYFKSRISLEVNNLSLVEDKRPQRE